MFSWLVRLFFLLSIALSLSTNSPVSGIATTMSSNNNDDVVDEESSRETLKPWSDRWKKRRIGFHLKDVNPALAKHAASMLPANQETETCSNAAATTTTRIFVPLCGKAIDMAYLATSLSSSNHKIEVLGLEGIRIALEEFLVWPLGRTTFSPCFDIFEWTLMKLSL